jgi:aryl carrier-like protein
LKIERIGIHDNFFDLGGDSVVAIQLVAQAAASGLVLTTEELFEKQTIAALSAAGQAEPASEVPAIEIPTPETEEVLASAELSDADLSPESLDRLFARLKDLA